MLQLVRNRRTAAIAAAAAVVLLVVLIGLFSRGGEPARAEEKPAMTAGVEVTASSVVLQPLTDFAEATGTVKSISEARIAPKIMSNVSAVYVREGDHVSRGQLLVKLEAADLGAQVAQSRAALSAAASQAQAARRAVTLQEAQSSVDIARAQAEVTAAREQLAVAKTGPRKQERSQAKLAVVQAQAQMKNAETELKRMKRLYAEDAVALQRVDQAQTAYDVAKAQYDAAVQQSDMVEEGSRLEDIRTAEARVRQAEESLRMARAAVVQNKIREEEARTAASEVGRAAAAVTYASVQRGYATITAPMSGIVTARLVDPGDTVSPGMPVVVVEDSSRYRIDVTVPEGDISLMKTGMPVSVRIDASDMEMTGRVAQIVPSGDPGSRKFLVKVHLPLGVGVKTGQFGRVSFPRSTRNAVTVPASAIDDSTGVSAVYVVGTDGAARMQVVRTGKTYNGRTEIVSGLSGGEQVVTSDVSALSDGSPVHVRRL